MSDTATRVRVAVLVGSLRTESINRGLAEMVRDHAPEHVEVEIIEGLDRLPYFNEDDDGDVLAPAAVALRETVGRADCVLVVTPEYNGSMPGLIKNAIDWLSRPYGSSVLTGMPLAVAGATPTPYGGRWAHEDVARSAAVAGAAVVQDATVSQSTIGTDVTGDEHVRERFLGCLEALLAFAAVGAEGAVA